MKSLSPTGTTLFLTLFLLSDGLLADDNKKIVLGKFSQQTSVFEDNWEKLSFASIPEHTSYTLAQDNKVKVLKAISHNSASGISKKIRFNPKEYPYLSWRWKINKRNPATNVNLKSGDDYAARVYIVFDYDFEDLPKKDRMRVKWYKLFHGKLPPLATINYIWGNQSPIERFVSSPYTDRVKMVILRNKDSAIRQWHIEERNIYKDYKKAFAEEPKDVINLVIMTDTDNTGADVVTLYGDISIAKFPEKKFRK